MMALWKWAALAALAGPAMADAGPSTTEAIKPDLADPATEILALEEDRARRFTVPVMVEGQGPYNFMIDTGSQATVVTHKIRDRLGLAPAGSATLIALASSRSVELVEVNSMSFGSNIVRDLISPVLESAHVGADGIIGLDSLQDFRVLIDFRAETIAVQNIADDRSARRGFEIIVRARQELGQLLITDAEIEGVRATVIIDTGAQGSIGNRALLNRVRTKRAEMVTATDVHGADLVGQSSFVRSLTIQKLQLADVPLIFADTPAFEALGLQDRPAISLGMDHLRMFDRVAIDFAEQRILFDVPRAVERELKRNRRASRLPNL